MNILRLLPLVMGLACCGTGVASVDKSMILFDNKVYAATAGGQLMSDTSSEVQHIRWDEAGTRLLHTYVYAVLRSEVMSDFSSYITALSEDTTVLSQFGLASIEQVQSITQRVSEAEKELNAYKKQQQSASDAFAAYQVNRTVSSYKAPEAETNQLQTDSLIADHSDLNRLHEALLEEQQAKRDVSAAKVKVQSGHMDSAGLVEAQEHYLKTRLQAIAIKEAFVESLIDRFADDYRSIHQLLLQLEMLDQQAGTALLDDWLRAVELYSIETSLLPAANVLNTHQGDPNYSSPSGQSALTLPYTSIAFLPASVQLPLPPFQLSSGDVYVPIRSLAEALGYHVEWQIDEEEAVLTSDNTRIVIANHSKQAVRNDQSVQLDAETYVQHAHMFVPLSFFSEMFNCEVYWNETYQLGIISPSLHREEG